MCCAAFCADIHTAISLRKRKRAMEEEDVKMKADWRGYRATV